MKRILAKVEVGLMKNNNDYNGRIIYDAKLHVYRHLLV